jgi:eukaryotic-like serine/threonine-protein kinase
MPASPDEQWRSLSDHLDRILDRSGTDRSQYLADLAASDPETAAKLAKMLGALNQDAFAEFLSGSPPRAAAEIPETTLVGRKVGAYVIDAEIGRGGMGSVWRAQRVDGRFEGTVAIKFVHLAWIGKAGEQRFRVEGKLLGQLDHVNIARLIDAGVLDSTLPYLVLEYVEGEPIDVYCSRENPDVQGRVAVFLSVLAAVGHAHSHLIVHRDIKPANIFVTRDGTVKLLDFGIAKLLGDATGAAAVTQTSSAALTPRFAAPEQLLGQPVTTATDVYSLGLVLFVLLTGNHPVAAQPLSSAELIRRAVSEEAPLASSMATITGISRRLLEGDLDNILAKALKRSPAERYASVDAFADDLKRYLAHEPVYARPDSLSYRVGKFVRRNRGAVAVGTIVALILVSATIVTYLQKVEADRQRQEAQVAAKKADASYHFLSEMVEEIGAEGGALSPTQIIDRGMYLLDHQPNADSRVMVDEMRQMATFYFDLFDSKKSLDVLTRAETLARRIGYTEGLIFVQGDLLDTDLEMDHRDKAQARLAEAHRLLAGLGRPLPLLSAMVEEQDGTLESANDRNDAAIPHAQRALEILRASGNTDDPLYPAVLSRLSVYYDALGNAKEAHRYTELSTAGWDQIEGSGTMHHLTNLNNEAADLTNFGEARAALATSAEVIRRLDARGASRTVRAPFQANYGAKLAALGRYTEALTNLDDAIVAAGESKNVYWQHRAQMFRACALVRAGRYVDARPALDQIEGAYSADAVKNAASLHVLRVCRAEWRLGTGNISGAKTLLDALLKEIDYPVQSSAPVLRSALPAAAKVALARNDISGAQDYASAGVAYADKVARDPNQSADRGRALALLAEAQHAAGSNDAAVRTLQQAVPALSGGLGADHAEVTDAQALITAWSQR